MAKEMVQDMLMPGESVAELRVAHKPVTQGLLVGNAILDIDCQRVQLTTEAPASNSKRVDVSEQSQEQDPDQNCRIQ